MTRKGNKKLSKKQLDKAWRDYLGGLRSDKDPAEERVNRLLREVRAIAELGEPPPSPRKDVYLTERLARVVAECLLWRDEVLRRLKR